MSNEPAAKRTRRVTKRRKFKTTGPSTLMLRPLVPQQENVFSTTRRFRIPLGFAPTTLVTDNGGFQTTYGLSVNLGDLPNWQEYTSLFDQFRITGAEVEFIPRYNTNVLAVDNNLVHLGWFQDQNNVDLTGFTSVENPWLERTGYRQQILDRTIKVKFTPRPQMMVYQSAIATGYAQKSPKAMNDWIASTNYNVPHFGLYFRVYAPDATATSAIDMMSVYVNLSFQCKSTR